MEQNTHTAINWLDRSKVQELLEDNGMAVYDSESTDDLKDTLRDCIESGDIAATALEV